MPARPCSNSRVPEWESSRDSVGQVQSLLPLFPPIGFFLNLFQSEKSKGDVSHLNVKMHQLGCELAERKASHGAGPGTVQLQSQRLAEAEQLRGAEMAARLQHHQQHAACWMETELLQQQLRASQEKVGVIQLVAGC